MQINALIAAGVDEADIYYETVSGASKRRPQFDAMMKDARHGDVIVFWKLDRPGMVGVIVRHPFGEKAPEYVKWAKGGEMYNYAPEELKPSNN